jgi:hypothetical protein
MIDMTWNPFLASHFFLLAQNKVPPKKVRPYDYSKEPIKRPQYIGIKPKAVAKPPNKSIYLDLSGLTFIFQRTCLADINMMNKLIYYQLKSTCYEFNLTLTLLFSFIF